MKERIKQFKLPLIMLVVYLVTFIVNRDVGMQALLNTRYYLLEMIQVMPVVFLLTVSLNVLIPREWIIKRFGSGSGFAGMGLSLLLGSISAGPIYAAFPICKILLKKGASVKNIVIVLSAWAVIKVPMLANEAKFLGPEFMAVRWILTVLMIFVMAFIMDYVFNKDTESLISTDDPLTSGKLVVDEQCVACGKCVREIPQVFSLVNGRPEVNQANIIEFKDEIESMIDDCPVGAIKFLPDDSFDQA